MCAPLTPGEVFSDFSERALRGRVYSLELRYVCSAPPFLYVPIQRLVSNNPTLCPP
jgi:hypothetical protein